MEEYSVSLGDDARVIEEEGEDLCGEVGGSVWAYGREWDDVVDGNAVRTCAAGRVKTGEVPAAVLGTMDKSEGNVKLVMEVSIEPRREDKSWRAAARAWFWATMVSESMSCLANRSTM